MIKQTYFCDADGKEFDPKEGISNMATMLPRMNEKLEEMLFNHAGNYCGSCAEMILQFIATLKDEHKSRSTN